MRSYIDNIVQKISDTVNHILYSLSGSIVIVGKLIKDTNVIGYQPIMSKQVKTCICLNIYIKMYIWIQRLTTGS